MKEGGNYEGLVYKENQVSGLLFRQAVTLMYSIPQNHSHLPPKISSITNSTSRNLSCLSGNWRTEFTSQLQNQLSEISDHCILCMLRKKAGQELSGSMAC